MDISLKQADGYDLLCITGRLDAATAGEGERQITELTANTSRLLVDMAGLEYISSAGLRVLLIVAKKMGQRGGRLALCALTPGVKEVFDISGFSSIFKIFPTRPEGGAFLK
ncbi:STAS domain-containing protein [Victivallis sp. Marseille-Q1083]|uniref:STAS domain-containing protein n=1 Tax=Victivallis sp. Marseille-Q1083 TaxID=2717288 RepID=UPI00158830AC|nr:STAS domain-containing protein [Victivallis sp. Marseille-Q1083]